MEKTNNSYQIEIITNEKNYSCTISLLAEKIYLEFHYKSLEFKWKKEFNLEFLNSLSKEWMHFTNLQDVFEFILKTFQDKETQNYLIFQYGIILEIVLYLDLSTEKLLELPISLEAQASDLNEVVNFLFNENLLLRSQLQEYEKANTTKKLTAFCLIEGEIAINCLDPFEFFFETKEEKYGSFAINEVYSKKKHSFFIECFEIGKKGAVGFGVLKESAQNISDNEGERIDLFCSSDISLFYQYKEEDKVVDFSFDAGDTCIMILDFEKGIISYFNDNKKMLYENECLKGESFRVWFRSMNTVKCKVSIV